MEISRQISTSERVIPKNLQIREEEWVDYANENLNLLPRHKWYEGEIFRSRYFIKKDEKKIERVELIWRAGRIFISSSRMTKRAIVIIAQISKDLNAHFLKRAGIKFPQEKIDEAILKTTKD